MDWRHGVLGRIPLVGALLVAGQCPFVRVGTGVYRMGVVAEVAVLAWNMGWQLELLDLYADRAPGYVRVMESGAPAPFFVPVPVAATPQV